MRVDVLIVGGGLAGAALAVALRQSRLSVAVIEVRAPVRPAGWDARIYAISPANAQFLRQIGIWDRLDPARLQRVARMSIAGDGDGHLAFSAHDSGASELAWICESSALQCELWETLTRQANVSVVCPARPQVLHVADHAVRLDLDDGQQLSAALLVAADGADSWVRSQSGIPMSQRTYDQLGVVANFAVEHEHIGTAFQWFRGSDVLAWLPLPERQISMVWSLPNALGTDLMQKSPEDFAEAVRCAGNGQLGAMRLLSAPSAFPLRLMRAERTVRPRLALIGDAAHAIHPLSGHGINLGFQDAAVLASVLRGKQEHQDCGSVALLRAYERARKEEVLALQAVTDGLHKLFSVRHDPLTPWAGLRNAGMTLTDRIPLVKDWLVRYALAS